MANIKKSITEALGLPKEIIFGLPYITLSGKDEIIIENHKGLITADACLLKAKSACGVICVCGKDLFLKEIAPNYIKLAGNIEKVEFRL